MLTKISKFWAWVIVSSSDPSQVALTVKGVVSYTVVQTIFGLLPYIGIHLSFSLADVGNALYTLVYGGLSFVSGLLAVWGLIRKVYLSITGQNQVMSAYASFRASLTARRA